MFFLKVLIAEIQMNLKWAPSDSSARHFGKPGFFYKTKKNTSYPNIPLGFRRQYYVQSKNGTKLCVLKHAYACIFESMLSITESELQTELRQVDSPSNKRTAAPPYSPPLPPNKSQ
jgi:hypothetical protein